MNGPLSHRAALRFLFRAATLGGIALAACCSPAPSERNLVLITIDTTRADRVGIYGDPDARTPTLDLWARRGVLAEQAIVDVPITLPSHTTILTATPAPGHGVRTNTDFRLGPEASTLAERLAAAGWETSAIVSSRALARDSGIDQGFESFDDSIDTPHVMIDPSRYPKDLRWLPPGDRRADEAVDLAIDRLRGAGSRPFFLWLHLIDPHAPYDPPRPFGEVEPDLYRGEIAFTDSQLRRLARALEELGLDKRTLLIATADHGEGLGDHLEDEHGLFIYDETVHVPLVMHGPGLPAGRLLAEQVRSIDIAPTALDLLGERGEFGTGASLVPAIRGTGPVPDSVAYCETLRPRLAYGAAPLRGLRTSGSMFIWAPRPELYDLASDPGERTNLLSGDPAAAEPYLEQLQRRVDAIRAASPRAAIAPDRDEESLAALRALGYVGSSPGGGRDVPEDVTDVDGPDPKDVVDVVLSGRDVEMGYYDRAEEKIRRFLRTADPPDRRPELRPLWARIHQNRAAERMARGEFSAAADSYRESLAYDPGSENAAWGIVFALNLAGRSEDAVREADALLEKAPDGRWILKLHRAMGLALLGRRDAARAAFARIARDCPDESMRGFSRDAGDRIGTDSEKPFLDQYLHAEGREARASP